MRTRPLFVALSFALGAVSGFSQAPAVISVVPVLGETNLRLDVGFGIRFVAPSRVTVPEAEQVSITGPLTANFIWTKDGRDIPGTTSNPLILPSVTNRDVGIYVQSNRDPAAIGKDSQALVLSLGASERLLNLSTRGWVGPNEPFIGGFVVSTRGGTVSKKLIIRAIGPSLSKFGVPNPLQRPTLKIYDSAGRPYTMSYAYPAVVGGLTYETDLAQSLAKTGAFPVPTGLGESDVTEMRPFVAGSYTVQIGSADGSAGNVLFEVYEVP